jgi:hypothetical protein
VRWFFTIILVSLSVSSWPVNAGFDRWTADKKSDPFSGGQKVTVTNMSSMRSGIVIFCDSAETGLTVRAIPGYAYQAALALIEPDIQFAFDGKKMLSQKGETGTVGDNLAVSQVTLSPENSRIFAKAFAGAVKQVAIQDGISDQPHLMTARGSTKSGRALIECMQSQE